MNAGHGTYAGWNRHQRDGTPVCLDCREALRQYKANRRRQDPQAYRREKDQQNARVRALWRLAALLPAEFAALTAEELAKGERASA